MQSWKVIVKQESAIIVGIHLQTRGGLEVVTAPNREPPGGLHGGQGARGWAKKAHSGVKKT